MRWSEAAARSTPTSPPTAGAWSSRPTTAARRTSDRRHLRRDGAQSPTCTRLVRSDEFDQAYTPRWSPDNRHVAYSSWKRGRLPRHPHRRHAPTARSSRSRTTARSTATRRTRPTAGGSLPLGPHRRHERLRLRARDRRASPGHQRRQRRLPAGALARRQDARRTSATRTQGYDVFAMPFDRPASSTRCPTTTTAPPPPAPPPHHA